MRFGFRRNAPRRDGWQAAELSSERCRWATAFPFPPWGPRGTERREPGLVGGATANLWRWRGIAFVARRKRALKACARAKPAEAVPWRAKGCPFALKSRTWLLATPERSSTRLPPTMSGAVGAASFARGPGKKKRGPTSWLGLGTRERSLNPDQGRSPSKGSSWSTSSVK
jgi:hypothetical protein